jgi:hypothetical protein
VKDYFISYTSADSRWAEWIAWTLEEAGLTVVLQAWDFKPGSNFVLEMDRAAKEASRTICVLTQSFLDALYTAPEWAARFAQDPRGEKQSLLPVRVGDCEPEGLLKAVIYVDLVGCDEAESERKLLAAVRNERGKPSSRPRFPGSSKEADRVMPQHPSFPAEQAASVGRFMPRIHREATDLEKKRFAKEAFERTRLLFEANLSELHRSQQQLDAELYVVHSGKFVCEVFVRGQSINKFKLWIGGLRGSDSASISYKEGMFSIDNDDSCNDILSVEDTTQGLRMRALMSALGRESPDINPSAMTIPEAAEYIWRRFAARLER